MRFFSRVFGSSEFRERLEGARIRLYRLAYSWCHDAALADDLAQETLIKALKKSSQLRDMGAFEGWLFRILSNCWRDHLRQRRSTENIDDLDDAEEMPFASFSTPEDAHGQKQLVARVRAAVERLPLGQRQVLTLIDLEECSYSETAEILGIPIGTVMSRICRARKALKLQLLERPPLGLVGSGAISRSME